MSGAIGNWENAPKHVEAELEIKLEIPKLPPPTAERNVLELKILQKIVILKSA